jgi:ParB-like chromosome segregation protein Spo0J
MSNRSDCSVSTCESPAEEAEKSYGVDEIDLVPTGRLGRRTVAISTLRPGRSPRSEGVEQEHVFRLAGSEAPLPPLLVDRELRVIDGMHRLLAALLQGRTTIEVELFEGSDEDAFLLAVSRNVVHGLPLSQVDRRAAAGRILRSHPQMSDRAIARIAGLSSRTVVSLRAGTAGGLAQSGTRVGRDGRARPLDATQGRLRAARILKDRPDASLREIARLAGTSPATVSDVRRRLAAGDSVVPLGDDGGRTGGERPPLERKARGGPVDPASVLEKLVRDPALRHKEEGRHLLRLLRLNAMAAEEWAYLSEVVPAHCGDLVAVLARQYAETWRGFAKELDERFRTAPETAVSANETTNNVPDEFGDDVSDDVGDDVSDDVLDDVEDDIAEDVRDDVGDRVTDEVTDEVTDGVTDGVGDGDTDDVTDVGGNNGTDEDVTDDGGKNVTDDATKDARAMFRKA